VAYLASYTSSAAARSASAWRRHATSFARFARLASQALDVGLCHDEVAAISAVAGAFIRARVGGRLLAGDRTPGGGDAVSDGDVRY
jgi:hypothetical protein